MTDPRIVPELMGELRERMAQWLWEVQPNSTTPWDAIGDFGRDSFRRLADQVLAGPLAPLLAKLQAIYELEAASTDAAMREAAARDYFGRDYIPIESSFDQPMLGPNVAFRGGWRAAMRAIAALQPPAPNPEEDS